MPHPLLSELINGCTPGDRLCPLPISRELVEDACWLTPGIALFPPETLKPADPRVVEWPARRIESIRRAIDSGGIALSEDDLHWAQSAATNIGLPGFFGSTLFEGSLDDFIQGTRFSGFSNGDSRIGALCDDRLKAP